MEKLSRRDWLVMALFAFVAMGTAIVVLYWLYWTGGWPNWAAGRRSTHFARDLLKVFGGGIAQALRLILVTDLLERRHGVFQNLGGLTFVFDVGPVKNLYGKPDPSQSVDGVRSRARKPDSIVAGIPASASRRIFGTSTSSDMALRPFAAR